jgi:hypothetical protein
MWLMYIETHKAGRQTGIEHWQKKSGLRLIVKPTELDVKFVCLNIIDIDVVGRALSCLANRPPHHLRLELKF